jgi:SAM-dependent methyltransferase
MPAAPIPRQAGVSSWFATGSGGPLLQIERRVARAALERRPAQPWLWLSSAAVGEAGPGRGLRLRRSGDGYDGDVRCGLPLPLPSESIQAIVVQHAVGSDAAAFLEECARVLAPGGRLWLFTLNPYSPYRLRWRRRGPRAWRPERWRGLLQQAGLYCPPEAQSYLGPAWRVAEEGATPAPAPWRAVCMFEAEKRASVPLGPAPAQVRWRRPVATI